jgi:hypothetical protein
MYANIYRIFNYIIALTVSYLPKASTIVYSYFEQKWQLIRLNYKDIMVKILYSKAQALKGESTK